MSEVNADDLRKIESIDDVIDTYQGAGNDQRTGVEIELAFFDPRTPDLTPMSPSQNKALKTTTEASQKPGDHDFIRNEPTSEMLEISSIAGRVNELRHVMDTTQTQINLLTQKAQDLGLKRSYFQHLPERTTAQLLQNVMDLPRYQAFFNPPRKDMSSFASYFTVCKSNQVSLSYKDPEHLLANIRRLYALAPFLFMLTDNNAPFNEGQPFTGHAGMYHRADALQNIPPHLYTAQTGEEYVRSHIDSVMNNPLFVYYSAQGELICLPSGTWSSFNKLRDKGLNTATNYFFSESVLWPDIKIAALKDANNQVINHRYEARMFGVGIHQHQTALLIVAALAFDETFAKKIDQLLQEFGFDLNNPEALEAPITTAYNNAKNHNQQFLNIPYGTGTMQDFAQDFAALLKNSALMQDFEQEISPILTICKTGNTDSKVNAQLFNTLDKATEFQRSHNPDMFKDPTTCAHDLFATEIEEAPAQQSRAS